MMTNFKTQGFYNDLKHWNNQDYLLLDCGSTNAFISIPQQSDLQEKPPHRTLNISSNTVCQQKPVREIQTSSVDGTRLIEENDTQELHGMDISWSDKLVSRNSQRD